MPFQFSQVPATLQSSPGKPIVSAGAGHVEGFGFFANTTERDNIGAFFRQSDFIAFVGNTIYRYTGPTFTPSNADAVMAPAAWTSTANWTEITSPGGVSLPIDITDVTNLSSQLASLVSDVSGAESDISTNASDISTNGGAISTNASNIATNGGNITSALLNAASASAAAASNATDISTNATDISTNSGAISTNASDINSLETTTNLITSILTPLASDVSGHTTDISTNASDISTNAAAISTNAGAISTNAGAITAVEGDVATNTAGISTNAGAISTNSTAISTNSGAISTNASDITAVEGSVATNTSGISTNAANISTNSAAISTNAGAISTNASDITAVEGTAATNATAISTNASDISTNDAAISTNSAAISTNASGLATAVSDIATNTSGVSTNAAAISTNAAAISTNSGSITALQTDKLDTATFTGHTHDKVDITDFDDDDYTPSTTVATTETSFSDWGSNQTDIDSNLGAAKIVYFDGTDYKHTSLLSVFGALANMIASEAGSGNNSLYGTQLGSVLNPADLDGDGSVGISDVLMILQNYGAIGFGFQPTTWRAGRYNHTGSQAGGADALIDDENNPTAFPSVVLNYTPGDWVEFDLDVQDVGLEDPESSFFRVTGTVSSIYDTVTSKWVGYQTAPSSDVQYHLENNPNLQVSFGASSHVGIAIFEGPDIVSIKRVLSGHDSSGNQLTFADGSDYQYESVMSRGVTQAAEYVWIEGTSFVVHPEPHGDLNQLRATWYVSSENGNMAEVALYDKTIIDIL